MIEGSSRHRQSKNIINKDVVIKPTKESQPEEIIIKKVQIDNLRDRLTRNIVNKDASHHQPIQIKKLRSYHNYDYPEITDPKIKNKSFSALNINIETWADIDKQTYYCWGDYWVKQKLAVAFEKLGLNVGVHPKDADFTVYLWGSAYKQRMSWPFFYNPFKSNINICWHYSHPTKMTPEELKKYHIIFSLSKYRIPELSKYHPNIMPAPLLSCTDFEVPEFTEKDKQTPIDILFVGNARGGLDYGRKAIYWLNPPENTVVEVYGHKWHLSKYNYMQKWYVGQYWPYQELNKIYNRAKVTLVDGHEDMGEFGFVPMKIFDVLASGGFVIAAKNIGIKDIFGDTVPQFENKDEMNSMVNYYLKHEDERRELAKKGFEIATTHKYIDRAKTILAAYKEYINL